MYVRDIIYYKQIVSFYLKNVIFNRFNLKESPALAMVLAISFLNYQNDLSRLLHLDAMSKAFDL